MRFSRTEALVGAEGMARLRAAHVALFGLGGVGSYVLEALARAGVGHLRLIDFDAIEPSNINRQLLALDDTVGRAKVDVARERVAAINPDAEVETFKEYVSPDNVATFLEGGVEYVVDAIDHLEPKVHLLLALHGRGLPFVSCMGSAAKLLPTGVKTGDIHETRYCPLARRVRQELKRHGVTHGVRCVYTEESPKRGAVVDGPERALGTISYVPGLVGLTAAGLILTDILA